MPRNAAVMTLALLGKPKECHAHWGRKSACFSSRMRDGAVWRNPTDLPYGAAKEESSHTALTQR